MTETAQREPQPSPGRSNAEATVVVWDPLLRVMHWALAASVLIAWFTANIFDTVHEVAGYTALALVALRVIWGFVGPHHARFASFVRPAGAVLRYLRRIVLGRTGSYLGHNPAGAAMTVTLLLLVAISCVSGWMQITERFFGVDWVEAIHTWSSHLVLILAAVHVLGVLLMCVLQRENLVRAMITGRKRARRQSPAEDLGSEP